MGLLETLRRVARRTGAESESDTEYDGAFSYADEFHAARDGFLDGIKSKRPLPGEVPDEYDHEAGYYRGAYLLGTAIHVGALVGLVLLTDANLDSVLLP